MRVLGIESATLAQGVALVEDDRCVAEVSYIADGTRGGLLLPALDDVLRKAGVAPKAAPGSPPWSRRPLTRTRVR